MSLALPVLLLASPALANANNGNWRTAARWSRLLAGRYRVIVQGVAEPVTGRGRDHAVAMLVLHARYGYPAAKAWKDAHPERALVVVLTGTDLYRDLPNSDRAALAAIALADRLVVLQDDAPSHVPVPQRAKVHVVFQSARTLRPWGKKAASKLNCLMVAHLRAEKDPLTLLRTWQCLPSDLPATLTVIGAALDPALGIAMRNAAANDSRIIWLGPKVHSWVRQAIKRAHVLVVPSRMEGGANVIVEALTSGTAVLGSRMSGNVGMLGRNYPGLFPVGDEQALARLITQAHQDRDFLIALEQFGHQRAGLFAPETEVLRLAQTVDEAICACGARMTN